MKNIESRLAKIEDRLTPKPAPDASDSIFDIITIDGGLVVKATLPWLVTAGIKLPISVEAFDALNAKQPEPRRKYVSIIMNRGSDEDEENDE